MALNNPNHELYALARAKGMNPKDASAFAGYQHPRNGFEEPMWSYLENDVPGMFERIIELKEQLKKDA